ncbi:MAG: ribosomal subunit interface protein [Cellvibrionaceae bacterium]|jgi:ribosomal subunit interface protein
MANQVTYRDMDPSQALNAIIDKRLEKLTRYSSDIQYSRVVIESPHNHKHKGKQFRATVEIEIKGSPITISQDDASIHIAVRDAFNSAERKLKSHTEKLHSWHSDQLRRNARSPDDDIDAIAS